MKHLVIALILSASAIAFSAPQQQPRVDNTQFNTEPASTGLSATVTRFRDSGQQLWIGYEVLSLPRAYVTSCSDSSASSSSDDGCCGELLLERDGNGISVSDKVTDPNPAMYVLLRLDHGAITRVRTSRPGCRLNAGGVPFTWLTGVNAEDSANFLGSLASKTIDDKQPADGALAALAMHGTPTATKVLASLAAPSNSERLREKAAFWLGAQRGRDGFLVLQKFVKDEPNPKLREKLAFDISINKDPAATDELLALAKSDSDPHVRGQALFWLAQKAGQKASSGITNAIENDPDTEVKKKAVFALSQLPKDEGIPQLIHVADSNPNLAVRKQAIFWLGQSHDPRALDYIESVLKR
ncbi:MAG TPA: HEAT repeat domain-containing protein [Edaphobacter sp.]